MGLSKNTKTFCCNFIAFLGSTLNFEHSEKTTTTTTKTKTKKSFMAEVFPKLFSWLLTRIKGPVSENTSVVNVLTA